MRTLSEENDHGEFGIASFIDRRVSVGSRFILRHDFAERRELTQQPATASFSVRRAASAASTAASASGRLNQRSEINSCETEANR